MRMTCCHSDITLDPAAHLSSRKPVWLDSPPEDMTANSAWSDEWAATDVVNHSLVANPSVCPPGFDLPRQHWSMLNRFRTGQRRCASQPCPVGPSHQSELQLWGTRNHAAHCQRVSADSFQRQNQGSLPGWTRCCSVAGHAMQTLINTFKNSHKTDQSAVH